MLSDITDLYQSVPMNNHRDDLEATLAFLHVTCASIRANGSGPAYDQEMAHYTII